MKQKKKHSWYKCIWKMEQFMPMLKDGAKWDNGNRSGMDDTHNSIPHIRTYSDFGSKNSLKYDLPSDLLRPTCIYGTSMTAKGETNWTNLFFDWEQEMNDTFKNVATTFIRIAEYNHGSRCTSQNSWAKHSTTHTNEAKIVMVGVHESRINNIHVKFGRFTFTSQSLIFPNRIYLVK